MAEGLALVKGRGNGGQGLERVMTRHLSARIGGLLTLTRPTAMRSIALLYLFVFAQDMEKQIDDLACYRRSLIIRLRS